MREIKFRGKRVDNGEWVYGYYMSDLNMLVKHVIYTIDQRYNRHVEVYPETVGQYTGLKDKDGKEVYEGDVLKEVYYPLGSNPKVIEYYKIGEAVWPNGFKHKVEGTTVLNENLKSLHHKTERKTAKHPTQGEGWVESNASFYRMQIIGNIHDNPNLLQP